MVFTVFGAMTWPFRKLSAGVEDFWWLSCRQGGFTTGVVPVFLHLFPWFDSKKTFSISLVKILLAEDWTLLEETFFGFKKTTR